VKILKLKICQNAEKLHKFPSEISKRIVGKSKKDEENPLKILKK
jgi:hypothetical protein